jgi:hypothetical protein
MQKKGFYQASILFYFKSKEKRERGDGREATTKKGGRVRIGLQKFVSPFPLFQLI